MEQIIIFRIFDLHFCNTNSIDKAVIINSNPATKKLKTVQLTSSVNCIAISETDKRTHLLKLKIF